MRVGVIVGRFQVDMLHSAHKALITYVKQDNDYVLILVGKNKDVRLTRKNPLPFEFRQEMIYEWTDGDSNIQVEFVVDMHDDALWSQELDAHILELCEEGDIITLYGGRDSFLEQYHGQFPVKEFTHDSNLSPTGTEMREMIYSCPINNQDFRAGIIWAAHHRYPAVFATVDVAIFDSNYEKILLGRKPHEEFYRLIGGFADPESPTFEADAAREALEEASVHVYNIQYLMSNRIDDWRYRREIDKIKSLLFIGVTNDLGKAGDDIEEVKWFWPHELGRELENVGEHHRAFVRMALTYAYAISIGNYKTPNEFLEGP